MIDGSWIKKSIEKPEEFLWKNASLFYSHKCCDEFTSEELRSFFNFVVRDQHLDVNEKLVEETVKVFVDKQGIATHG